MKTGRTLRELLKELERQETAKQDYISPASSLVLRVDGKTVNMAGHDFGTTALFHRQAAEVLVLHADAEGEARTASGKCK